MTEDEWIKRCLDGQSIEVFLAAIIKQFDKSRPAYQHYINPDWPWFFSKKILAHWILWQKEEFPDVK